MEGGEAMEPDWDDDEAQEARSAEASTKEPEKLPQDNRDKVPQVHERKPERSIEPSDNAGSLKAGEVPEPANPPSWKRKDTERELRDKVPGDGEEERKRQKVDETEKKYNTGGQFVPERVKDALRQAENFEKFRRNRKFRYLHMFSGGKDVLAEAIARECKSHRLEFEAESLDKKIDSSVDLSSERSYREIGKTIDEGDWDGFHGGFPCGSFSMARWNKTGRGPPPVRSAKFIYGLPGNSTRQQGEADRGTLMAAQTTWLFEKQVDSAKARGVLEVATLENPPGSSESGSAWSIPEIQETLQRTAASTVEFNTCAYQQKLKSRWYKPSKWVGKLDGLTSLARVCRCPNWVQHVPLIGKDKTEEAGAYPEDLATEIAKKVVQSWKRTLSLEWWRYREASCSEEVSQLQKKWLANEEKKVIKNASSNAQVHQNVISGTLDSAQTSKDVHPATSARPSKKTKREEENEFYLGGMRNPAIAVSRMYKLRETGSHMRKMWEIFAERFPEAREVGERYGSTEAKINPDILKFWKGELHVALRVPRSEGITLKENVEFRSPLNAELWDSWGREARDPEMFIGQWAREGAPLGMECRIDASKGIFPPANQDKNTILDPLPDLEDLKMLRNYTSMEEQEEDAHIELDRYLRQGFVKEVPWQWIVDRYGHGTVSRLALIVKEKPGGGKKRRVVIDLKRSEGNARAQIEERIILPRAYDVILMCRDMRSKESKLQEAQIDAGVPHWRRTASTESEIVLIDLKDAFCHFPINPKELKHCISPGVVQGTALIWIAMLFGFSGAPLVMGRLSAAIGRLLASLFHTAEAQVQVYVDDILVVLKGDKVARDNMISLIVYTLRAFGVNLSLDKGERGTRLVWIGTTFELKRDELILSAPDKMVKEVKAHLEDWKKKGMIPHKEVRSIVGKLSWLAGILPRMRWAVTCLYGALAHAEKEEREGLEAKRAESREKDQRPKLGLISVKRMGAALPWLVALLQEPQRLMLRREPLVVQEPAWAIITDASPKGLGAVLAKIHLGDPTRKMTIEATLEAIVQPKDAAALQVDYGEASSQGVMEALALVRAIQKWGPKIRGETILIRSDSTVALAMARKLASPHPSINFLAAELGIQLEHSRIPKLVLQHLAGKLNVEADWLSRIQSRGQMPESLQGVPMARVVALKEGDFTLDLPGMDTKGGKKPPSHPASVVDEL